ncbi:MAG TPA: aminotransferase class I/II-fold pyridoxal phosphate-dependent enzyme, partial [Flavobacteriales bacterium]|nr:aminotransferase class I/II-fold pyridoxal phosphate-dependent enzyme [Flavobacteriales bacterium]
MKIPFNKSWLSGKETVYINELVRGEHFSGNGPFTRRCREVLSNQYGYGENYLTTSCTDALELSALLCDIGPGDEVILPSYTFVSTANAFALRGATLKFADSLPDHPNIDPASVKKLISKQTKAIVLMHYAGMACDMHALLRIAQEKNLFLIEDAAQCIGAYYEGQA